MAKPTVATLAASNVQSTSFTLNGEITATGGYDADKRGFDIYRKLAPVSSASITNFNYCHGLIYYDNYLYGVARTNPGKVAKISVADLSSFSLLTPQHDSTNAKELMDVIQVGGFIWTIDASGWLFKIHPDTFTVFAAYQIIGATYIGPADGALCSDGTYIYATGTGYVSKFKISDNSYTVQLIISGNAFHSIAHYGDYLYVNDTIADVVRKVAKADLSLVASSGSIGTCTDDVVIDGTYLYLTRETAISAIVRVTLSDLTVTVLEEDAQMVTSYGIFKVNDGVQDRLVTLQVVPYAGLGRLYINAISTCATVFRVDIPDLAGWADFCELAEDDDYLYFAAWADTPAYVFKVARSDIFTGESCGAYILEEGTFGVEAFDEALADMLADSTYYFKARAHNQDGWGYGSELSVETTGGGQIIIEAPVATISSESPVSSLRLDKIFDAPRLRIGQEDVY